MHIFITIISIIWFLTPLILFPYVNLTQRASSSFLSFIIGFGKEIISSFLILFSSLQVQGTLLFFLLFLFGLRAQIALNHLDIFISRIFYPGASAVWTWSPKFTWSVFNPPAVPVCFYKSFVKKKTIFQSRHFTRKYPRGLLRLKL